MLESQKRRLAHASRIGISAGLLTGCFSVALIYGFYISPVFAQGQGRGTSTDITAEQTHRNQEIQRVIVRANRKMTQKS